MSHSLDPGTRVTIRDVARVAGVSLGTVSRVLNGHVSVRPAVRQHVQEVVRSLRFERDASATSMRRKVTMTVGIAVRDSSAGGTSKAIRAAETVLRANGYTTLLANTNNDKDLELTLFREFGRRRVDGMIVTLSNDDDPDLLAAVQSARMPVVVAGRQMGSLVDSVTSDLHSGTRQATHYLLSLGHRRIALITGAPTTYPSRARIRGWQDAHAAIGLQPAAALLRTGSFEAWFGEAEAQALARLPTPPTAVVVGGMALLAGVLRGLRAAGLAVPRDMSVIAGADSDLADLSDPSISAVNWDHAELGERWAAALLRRMQGNTDGPQECTMPTTLLLRQSCGPPRL